jgi:hypothetical protein
MLLPKRIVWACFWIIQKGQRGTPVQKAVGSDPGFWIIQKGQRGKRNNRRTSWRTRGLNSRAAKALPAARLIASL